MIEPDSDDEVSEEEIDENDDNQNSRDDTYQEADRLSIASGSVVLSKTQTRLSIDTAAAGMWIRIFSYSKFLHTRN